MFYREAGQFRTSYAQDSQIFPLRQDRIGIAIILIAAALLPMVANAYWLSAILIPWLVLSLVALGQNILMGYAGQLSLGSAGFMAVGAFACYNLILRVEGIPFVVAVALSGVCAALVGIVFGLPSLRIRGLYLAVATLASQFFIVWALDKFPWFKNYDPAGVITAQPIIMFGHNFATPREKYWVVLVIVAVLALLAKNMARGSVGRGWMAVRDMDVAAEVDGTFAAAHQAAGLCDQLILLRRWRCAVCLRLSSNGRTVRVHDRAVIPNPVHGHHRRPRNDHGILPWCRFHPADADFP